LQASSLARLRGDAQFPGVLNRHRFVSAYWEFTMPLKPEQSASLLASTKGQATALLDDLQHLRTVCARSEPVPAEIRLVAVMLRRLLVDRHIANIANPRIGKLLLCAPDTKIYERLIRAGKIQYFACARAQAFNVVMGTTVIVPGDGDLPPDHDPEAIIDLRLDGFLNQRVFYFRGHGQSDLTATRKDVIQYVANLDHGAHSGTPTEPQEQFLFWVSQCSRYDRGSDGIAEFGFNPRVNGAAWEPYPYSATAINPVLFELLGTASAVCNSPGVLRLEAIIKSEIGA
jgi:hypothetical protein